MKILVTGADGMLGTNIVRMLLEKGHEVRIYVHPSSRSATLDGLPVQKFSGDICDPESMDKAIRGCDAVIHAAADTRIWPPRSEEVRKINIDGTENVIRLVQKHQVGRMVYVGSASSVNAAGTSSNGKALDGSRFGLDYIDSKQEALKLVLDAAKKEKLPAIAVLPTFMIGSYGGPNGSGKMILSVAKEKLPFYTSGGRNFIHVKDVASAIINSLTLGTIGNYYVAGNENLSYLEFFKKVSAVTGKPGPKLKIPGFIALTVGLLGSFSGKILNKEPLISYPVARISLDKQFVSSEEARNELRMPVTPIKQAILDCFNWYRQNGFC